MNTTAERDQITALAVAARQAVLRHLPKESCVATARVLIDVAGPLGWNVRPFCAGVVYHNDRHSIGTPYSGEPDNDAGTVGGHILVLAKKSGRGWLMDVSADMFSRPEHGLVITGPLAAAVQDGLFDAFRGKGGAAFEVPEHGFKVVWRMADNQMAWRASADWQVPDRKAALFTQMRADTLDLMPQLVRSPL